MQINELCCAAQLIRGLWYLYVTSQSARNMLLQNGLILKGIKLRLLGSNPYNDIYGSEKNIIRDLPFGISNEPLLSFLMNHPTLSLIRKFDIFLSKIRDDDNTNTIWENGDIYLYAQNGIPPQSHNNSQKPTRPL